MIVWWLYDDLGHSRMFGHWLGTAMASFRKHLKVFRRYFHRKNKLTWTYHLARIARWSFSILNAVLGRSKAAWWRGWMGLDTPHPNPFNFMFSMCYPTWRWHNPILYDFFPKYSCMIGFLLGFHMNQKQISLIPKNQIGIQDVWPWVWPWVWWFVRCSLAPQIVLKKLKNRDLPGFDGFRTKGTMLWRRNPTILGLVRDWIRRTLHRDWILWGRTAFPIFSPWTTSLFTPGTPKTWKKMKTHYCS